MPVIPEDERDDFVPDSYSTNVLAALLYWHILKKAGDGPFMSESVHDPKQLGFGRVFLMGTIASNNCHA
jgi:hypothetical protein